MKKSLISIRKVLNAKVKVSSLLTLICIAAFSITAIAAAATTVQATLSPDITVKYNGVVQTMKDVSGTEVYPIVYNGTTYVPIRAVSNMLGIAVDWESSTKTVLLGRTGEVRLVDVCDKQGDVWNKFDKMSSVIELPGGDSTRTFQSAILSNTNFISGVTDKGEFLLNGNFTTMKTTFYVKYDQSVSFRMKIFDHEKDLLLADRTLDSGQYVEVDNIDLAGVKTLRFEVESASSASLRENAKAYFLDPILK